MEKGGFHQNWRGATMNKAQAAALASAYRLAVEKERENQASDVHDCLSAMRSAGGNGGDLRVLRERGSDLVGRAIGRCETIVGELIGMHVQFQDEDAMTIAERVRKDFVDIALANLPGGNLYRSVRGQNAVAMERMLLAGRASFTGRRATVIASLRDRASVVLGGQPKLSKLQRLKRWAEQNQVVAAVVMLLGILGGLGWTAKDIIAGMLEQLQK